LTLEIEKYFKNIERTMHDFLVWQSSLFTVITSSSSSSSSCWWIVPSAPCTLNQNIQYFGGIW